MKYGRKSWIALVIVGACCALLFAGAALAEEDGFLPFFSRWSARAVSAAESAEIPEGLRLTEREEMIFRLGYAAGYDHEGENPGTRTGAYYVLNINKHKFHQPDCSSVDQIQEKNKREYHGSREELIDLGYTPCGKCNP